jgi:hypothetical protein
VTGPELPCCHCAQEIAECLAYTLLWGHRHAGCRGFIHQPGGKEKCGGKRGTVAEPGPAFWPAVLPTWSAVQPPAEDGPAGQALAKERMTRETPSSRLISGT